MAFKNRLRLLVAMGVLVLIGSIGLSLVTQRIVGESTITPKMSASSYASYQAAERAANKKASKPLTKGELTVIFVVAGAVMLYALPARSRKQSSGKRTRHIKKAKAA